MNKCRMKKKLLLSTAVVLITLAGFGIWLNEDKVLGREAYMPEDDEEEVIMIPIIKLRIVDPTGQPVAGLAVTNPPCNNWLTYSSGEISVIGDDSSEQQISVYNPVTDKKVSYIVETENQDTIELVWNEEIPSDSISHIEHKAALCVMDQNQNPVKDALFYEDALSDKDASFYGEARCIILPTDENGITYYYGQAQDDICTDILYVDSQGNGRNEIVFFSISQEQLIQNDTITIQVP